MGEWVDGLDKMWHAGTYLVEDNDVDYKKLYTYFTFCGNSMTWLSNGMTK